MVSYQLQEKSFFQNNTDFFSFDETQNLKTEKFQLPPTLANFLLIYVKYENNEITTC